MPSFIVWRPEKPPSSDIGHNNPLFFGQEKRGIVKKTRKEDFFPSFCYVSRGFSVILQPQKAEQLT
jgi:hypothetical protein